MIYIQLLATIIMKKFSFFLPFLLSFSVYGQQTAEGILKDSETGKPISYVNIGIVKKNQGTVSNERGEFKFEVPAEMENDTIILSSLGYGKVKLLAIEFLEKLKSNPIYELSPQVTELNEVIVSNKKLKEKIVGNKTKSGKIRGGFRNATLGHEVGIKIRIKNSPTFIKKFHTNVTSNTDVNKKYRMNFYNIKNGIPNEKIVQENIIFKIDVASGEFTLNLEEYDISVGEDFYCTIELIENQKPEDEMFFSAGFLGKKMAYRLTSQGKWEKTGAVGLGFSFIVAY